MDKIEKEYAEGKMQEKKPRILVTGCPIGGATEKVIQAIENNGGIVVTYENCTGAKSIDKLVDETIRTYTTRWQEDIWISDVPSWRRTPTVWSFSEG